MVSPRPALPGAHLRRVVRRGTTGSGVRGASAGREGRGPAGDTDAVRAEPPGTPVDGAAGGTDANGTGGNADRTLTERDPPAPVTAPGAREAEPRLVEPASADDPGREGQRGEGDAGGDSTAASRARTIAEWLAAAARRDALAELRDRSAAQRDDGAEERDAHADVSDRAVEARARGAIGAAELGEVIAAVGTLKLSGASNRQQSARERSLAASDREASGGDRRDAADDRRYSGLDELTGVFRRGTGELAVPREIDPPRRSGTSLVLAIIDIDELKAVNDNEGHAAGDALLRDVPTAISSTLRSYDITVRWG